MTVNERSSSPVFVIVGASHAASQAVASLRKAGFEGKLIMIGDEPHLPYHRPPLSKQYALGKQTREQLMLRAPGYYQKHDVTVRLSTRVTKINASQKRITISDGSEIEYDKLLLATGSRPRELPVDGTRLKGVSYLRTIDDVDRIRESLSASSNVCIIGGGYIGLEFASAAITLGAKVTVLEAQERLLKRVTTPFLSDFYYRLHTERGVDIRLNSSVTRIEGDDHVDKVVCGDTSINADLVVIGIGIVPNVEIAEAAGLRCNNGIVVDQYCQTSDDNIFAAGDCTFHPNSILARSLRLESVPNAMEQAKVAAANMLGDKTKYATVPWFWSDQYELKLQMVGFSDDGATQVIRGDVDENHFAVFHLRDDHVIAVDAVNSPREFMMCRKFYGHKVDAQRLPDTTLELKDLFEP